MSQRQFITYQSEILSFEAMEAFMGILNPGRYSGYSVIEANGSPAMGNIPLRILHTGGIQKRPKNVDGLATSIGVMVTTQGTIIHEDQPVTITILDNAGGAGTKFCIVYMEHSYRDGVPGDNPAIYGVINGVQGGGIPSMIAAYKRSIVGIVEIKPNGQSVVDCIWHPRPSDNTVGDTKLYKQLFGATYDLLTAFPSGAPANGIIGDLKIPTPYFIDNVAPITESLIIIDGLLKTITDAVTDLENRAIDNGGWGALTDNTNHNVSTGAHGLMPKLPNDETKFINGKGLWVNFPGMLVASNNLSDLIDTAAARANLDVLSTAEINSTYFYDSGWQNMTAGVAANAADFSMKIRRIGRLCMVTGQFTGGSNMSANAIIAHISYSSINPVTETRKPTVPIYFGAAAEIDDRRLTAYVQQYVNGDTNLYLKMHKSQVGTPDTDYMVNFSFYVD